MKKGKMNRNNGFLGKVLKIMKYRNSEVAKSFISMIFAFIILASGMGVYSFTDSWWNFASTAGIEAADVDIDPTDSITIDGQTYPRFVITTKAGLINYSQVYASCSDDHHEHDVLLIDFGEGEVNGNFNGFVSIGTDAHPFKGRIIFGESSATTFDLNCPFFGTVCDSVQIVENSTGNTKNITLTRTTDGIYEPLIANKIINAPSDAIEPSATATWSITANSYSSTGTVYNWPFAGFVGTLGTGASANISIDSLTTANIINSNGDLGLICNTMESNSTLQASYTGSNTSYSVTTSSGNVGGLVGTMGTGSTLSVTLASNPQSAGNAITTGSGFAGGVVGYNDGGTVNMTLSSASQYSIGQTITGTHAGSVYGFYSPAFSSNVAIFDISKYSLSTTLSGTGSVGGLFGALQNSGSSGEVFTITTTDSNCDTVTAVNSSGTMVSYGGIAGSYSASTTSDSLVISGIKVDVTNNGTVTNYGGAIGKIDNAAYVGFDGFTLVNATGVDGVSFAGLVSLAEDGFISVKNVTIGESEISGFNGAGLVNSIKNGVLALTGTIDISNAKPLASDVNGQLAAVRDNALIYAESWTYTPSDVEIDNIASWGDILLFDGTILDKADVLTQSGHSITFNSVDTTDIDSVADFAITSLLFQIDPSQNSWLSGTHLSSGVAITFTDDIDLTGTGLRGITRDNSGSYNTYVGGTVTGNDHTITLDIKNVGGTDRPVYYHQYNGLFGGVQNATVNNLYLDGSIKVKSYKDTVCVGALSGTAAGTLNVTECKTLSGLTINVTFSKAYTAGRFIGKAAKMGDINVSDCEFDGTISGNGDGTVGGVFGKIDDVADSTTPDWTFGNVVIKGTVSGKAIVGGLIADIAGKNVATVILKDKQNGCGVVADGVTVSGNGGSSGGLLGYRWANVDVDVTKVSAANNPTVSYTSSGGTAGLVYMATGHWTVIDLDLRDIKILASGSNSVGVIVNKGKNGSDGIYLELPSGYNYQLSFASDSNAGSGVFDELCAFSATSSSDIMTNGQGIVSISTTGGLKMESTATDSLSYKNQTTQGAKNNPNTRYYYNLDLIEAGNTLSDGPEKLMSWGVNQYAADNIRKYFVNPFGTEEDGDYIPIKSTDYDMKGYSWYPVTPRGPVTVAGVYTFYNQEFTNCENAKSTSNKWLPNSNGNNANQHYLMHNGLLYNINNNLTVGQVTLKGNIGAYNSSAGTGALVYGTVKGTSSATEGITVVSVTGPVSLAGIKVWNFGTVAPDYAPLFINKTGSFVNLSIKNISTGTGYANGEEAATSLIGKAGINDTDTYISVSFTGIKLDARTSDTDTSLSSHGYNTTKSIFTRATLLERLVGSSGTYLYSYSEDWTNNAHNVTYGKEVGYTNSDTTTQYPGLERWYYRSSTTDTQYSTKYSSAPSGDSDFESFSSFLPYVKTVSSASAISGGTGVYYQLRVNHQPTVIIKGCGTYNDPYKITSEDELIRISMYISGDASIESAQINALFGDTWCDNNKTEHKTYSYNGSNFVPNTGSGNKSKEEMRRYLASAYYIIAPAEGNTITLNYEANQNVPRFIGLGVKDTGYRFSGVIVGGEGVTIVNKTQYPFIAYSDGCVVKDLTIQVDSSSLPSGRIPCKGDGSTKYEEQGQTYQQIRAYGAVIGQIVGGDNIIDNVQLNLSSIKIYIADGNSQYVPIGGYVGVIINGGLVFRNMSGSISGLTDNTKISSNQDKSNTTMINSDNNAWLFVNPIIGRVINGYAVTETDAYRPREADVTMKNSTGDHSVVKHYSITDIKKYSLLSDDPEDGEKLDVQSNYNINIPDSQSFYLMSLMVNCGLSIQQGVNKSDVVSGSELGYFTGYYALHFGSYDDVGKDSSSDYTSYASHDIRYIEIGSTDYLTKKIAYVPYLVRFYSIPYQENISGTQTVYYAKTIGNIYGPTSDAGKGSKSVRITLSAGSGYTYQLPDGFRGIGNFFAADSVADNLRLNVVSFDGGGSTIDQNTKYYYYSADCNAAYRPADSENAGLGLFNCLNTNGTFENFILTGSVQCEAITKDNVAAGSTQSGVAITAGEHIEYKTASTNANRHMSAAMLFATVKTGVHPNIDSVALQNINVRGVRHTGGMIGNLIKSGNSQSAIVHITNDESYDSFGIVVHGAGSVAGLIGRNQEGIIQVDLNNCTFCIDEIVSECSWREANAANGSNTNKSDYNYGVGGFIGICRTGGTPTLYNEIKNVIIGTPDDEAVVQCTDGGMLFTGGVVGVINRANVDVDNCTFYNLSVDSLYMSGGLVADCITASTPRVTNTKLISTKGSVINATKSSKADASVYAYSGGFIGNTDERGDGGETFILRNCSIEGYTISAQHASGGVIGYRGAKSDSAVLQIESFKIRDCTIKSDVSAGGIAGLIEHPVQGYNILCEDIEIEAVSENTTVANEGFIIGNNNNDKPIKLVGFTYIDNDGNSNKIPSAIGASGTYGSGGYVVFADYNGLCLNSGTRSLVFSNVHSANNVPAVGGGTVTDNDPYVTSSAPTSIGDSATAGVSYFITSDGVVRAAYDNIVSDINSTTNGYYSVASGNVKTASGYITDFASAKSEIDSHLSTFQEEMGTKAINGIDFPMLVVDDVVDANTTALITNYLRLLTNTDYNFYYLNNGSSYADSNIYSVQISKCQFNDEGVLTITDNNACLEMNSLYFHIDGTNTDTKSDTAQFTLIDVQFKNPSDPSKIAYHLYVPVFVKKLVEYDFNIRLQTGTTYLHDPETSIEYNTLLENLGVPVTAEFEYVYTRTTAEWQTAVDSGDNLLSNYDKRLLFTNSSPSEGYAQQPGFESGNQAYDCHTKMVLIDSNNNGKAYYLDDLSSTAFATSSTNNRLLNLQAFTDSAGNNFSAVNFNDLMTVTATVASDGQFVRVTDDSATVMANSGEYSGWTFRLKNDSDAAGVTKYNLTVTDATSIKEHYFLTIYTEADYSTTMPIYHYAITAPDTLGSAPYPSKAENRQTSHLITGDIYTNIFSMANNQESLDMLNSVHLEGDDYIIEATLTSTVSISSRASSTVSTYLVNVPSIEIYQSFLTSMKIYDGSASPSQRITAIKDATATINSVPVQGSINANYIEFANNENLRMRLALGSVTNTANIKLIFDYEDIVGGEDLSTDPAQFLPGPTPGQGTALIGYSNIASDRSMTAYSKVSKRIEDNTNLFYYSNTETVDLLYSAYADSELGDYGQLGINAKEPEENPVPLTTLAVYDISNFQQTAANAEYMRIQIELKRIHDQYDDALTIGDFITDLEFITNQGFNPVSSDMVTSDKWTFIYDKDAFSMIQNRYQIPLNYSIYTGPTATFEGANRTYSNYKVIITVTLLDSNQQVIGTSEATDFIKYTNARIYTGRVNPNK